MSETVLLKAEPRINLGRSGVKKTRTEGKVPAVLYGKNDPRAIQLEKKPIIDALNAAESNNILVDLEVEGKKHLALIQDVQVDPLKDKVLHIDFNEVDEKRSIKAEVPLRGIGEPVGVVTGGGLLEQMIRSVSIECLPKDLPKHVDADISAINIGEYLHIKDIQAPEGVKILNQPELSAFVVHKPRVSSKKTGEEEAK